MLSPLAGPLTTVTPPSPTHAQILKVLLNDSLDWVPYDPPSNLPNLGMVYGEIGFVADKGRPTDLNADEVIQRFLLCFRDQVGPPCTHRLFPISYFLYQYHQMLIYYNVIIFA